MRANADKQRFRNEELVLQISQAVNRATWDESRYEAFLDELCGDREYQKEAIRSALRYLLGGEYADLRELARKNYDDNPTLESRYGSFASMERHLQLPDQLSASLDLATGTGKSYVMYGIAAIMLAHGAVDRVLVLCPSTTIEAGLLDKFKSLASNADLRDQLPSDAKVAAPSIISATQTITEGSICVENYHAILEHVGSSIRDSLQGKGARTLVLNDEAHHVANESAGKVKKWKEFLSDSKYGFRYVIGVSGTCYVGNDYFADVVHRYSLRQAMEEKYVKKVDYVAEMPKTGDEDETWQLILNRHEAARKKLKSRKITPLTIIITQTINSCKDVADELRGFLKDHVGISEDALDERVLVVYNNAPDVRKLAYVDHPTSKVEWIVAVSMLNEGWDVKRVFQIVPHEERAFNSKLLIAQVLGRGLRVPEGWQGEQPEVIVFNHDAWAQSIRQLVNEILEIDKRLPSQIGEASPYHFDLHNIDYTLQPKSVKKPMDRPYKLFEKGYVDLATDSPAEDVTMKFESALTGKQYDVQMRISRQTYTPQEIARVMFDRLREEPDDTFYADQFPIGKLEVIVSESLKRIGTSVATESMKQKFLQSLGTLRRGGSENVRYTLRPNHYTTTSTRNRQSDSVSASELRNTKTVFYTDQSGSELQDEQVEFFKEATEPGSGFKCVPVSNRHDFKTPLNLIIADHDNEKRFVSMLLDSRNVGHYEAWIKSTAMRFYEIDYAWKKGEHPKRGKFNPDFFIKVGDLIVVVEIKGDEELRDPSDENRKKNEYAIKHFDRINKHLAKEGGSTHYKFMFLTERSFNKFFQSLREGKIDQFRSDLDVKLADSN